MQHFDTKGTNLHHARKLWLQLCAKSIGMEVCCYVFVTVCLHMCEAEAQCKKVQHVELRSVTHSQQRSHVMWELRIAICK